MSIDQPRLRNIEPIPVEMSGRRMILLRDPMSITEKKLCVPYDVFEIISMFDGENSILDIQTAYTRRHGQLLFSDKIRQIAEELDANLLLESERFERFLNNLKDEFRRQKVRRSSHAGGAYSSDPAKLREEIDSFFASPEGPGRPNIGEEPEGNIKGVIAPHIDFQRGGPCYAWSYREVAESCNADLFIIFGTAHTQTENLFALTSKDFLTPFGTLEADKEFIESLTRACDFDLFEDELVHKGEHSIEFQVVFLQYLFEGKRPIRIVPILCASFHEMVEQNISPRENPQVNSFISALKETLSTAEQKVCLLASVDLAHVGMTFGDEQRLTQGFLAHVESEDVKMLKRVEELDAEGLFGSIQKDNDRRRICGFPAIYTMTNVIEANEGKLLKYAQAPDPNTQSAVTFASMIFV